MSDVDLARAAEAIEAFLAALGHPIATNPELAMTGQRVAEAFHDDLLGGYAMDAATILSETCASDVPGMVVLSGIATTTMCPHHLLPASGTAHVGYLPSGKLAGFGALGRLVQCFARRLTLQEQLGQDIADALVEHLGARAAGCVLDLEPACVVARGGRQARARAITTAFAGKADAEFRRVFQERLAG